MPDVHVARRRTLARTQKEIITDLFASDVLDVSILEPLILLSWCRATAFPGCQAAWSDKNPAWGQGAVTALLVHDFIGGVIYRSRLVEPFGSHYFNKLRYNWFDLTRGQFPEGTLIPPGEPVELDYILNSERAKSAQTRERFGLLKERFVRAMFIRFVDDAHLRSRP